MKSIQTKLTVIILTIFCMAMGILGGLNYWKAKQIITDDIGKATQEMAVNTANSIGDWLKGCELEISGISAAPVVQNGKVEEIIPFLNSVIKRDNRYESLAYVTPSGDCYNNLGVAMNISQREYFKKAIKGEAAVADPVVSKATGKMVIIAAVPVKTNGQVTGVLFGAISIADVAKRVLDIKVGETGYAYLQQQDGLIIIHPDDKIAMKGNGLTDEKLPPALRAVAERQVKGENGLAKYEFLGVEKMVAFAPVTGVNWSLAVNVPTKEVSGAVSSLTVISVATIIIVLIVTGLIIAWVSRRIAKPIQNLAEAANRIAGGDISETRVNVNSNDEIGRLGHSFEQMAQNLQSLIKKILSATEQVAASSEELTASSEQSAEASNQIATSITEVAAGASEQMDAAQDTTAVVEQMSAGIQQIAANANQVADSSAQAAERAKFGDQAVEHAVVQMGQIQSTVTNSAQVVAKLGERSKEIGQIVDTISGIAGQTNLLALNAAIEAARAGEQGRGFAVVAEEVRKLAEQSQDAAKKIAELIGEIQGDTDKAVMAMDNGTREVETGAEVVNNAGAVFREIAGLVTGVSSQVKEISAAMQQMAASSQHIVDSVKKIDNLGKKSAGEAQGVSAAAEEQLASMEEIASSSQSLAKLAQDLQTAVHGFRI
jgi:methyl-accepting chemotaxis protein